MAITPLNVGNNTASSPTSTTKPKSSFLQGVGNFVENALPTIGAVGGAIGGGALGGLATSPSLFGIPAGVIAGGAAGAGLGSAAGEAGKEALQKQALDPSKIIGTGVANAALEAVGGPVASVAGKGLEIAGGILPKMFIPKSDIEAGLLQTYKANVPFLDRMKNILQVGETKVKVPGTSAQAGLDRGVWGVTEGGVGVSARKAQNKLWDGLLKPALKASDTKVDLPAFLKETEAQIIKDVPELTRRNALLSALGKIQKDYKDSGEVNLLKFQDLKKGWADPVPDKAYKGDYISSAINEVRDMLAGNARTKIYNALGPDIKQAYLDHGNLNGLVKLGRKAMAGGPVKAGGTFTGIKDLFDQVAVPVSMTGGQVVYRIGKGLEFVGKPGAKTLRDVLGLPAANAALGAMDQANTTPQSATPPQGITPMPLPIQ